MPRDTWTKESIELLRKLYPLGKNEDLVKVFGTTVLGVRSAARRYGIRKEINTNNPYTAEKKALLIKLYPDTKNVDIAKLLGVTEGSVIAAGFRYGLKKTKEFLYECSKKGMFKKGQTPLNKGKKWAEFMSEEGRKNSSKTQFKKGEPNHNSLFDGAISRRADKSGRPYLYIRISKSIWKLYHVHLWEQKNGPVPKGYCVSFIDGNTLNVDLSNFELISRKENMLRNSGSMNLSDGYVANCIAWRDKEKAAEVLQHPELIELKRESLILNRTIYEQQKRVS